MVQKPLRVGIIGTGGMGGRHARNLAHRVSAAEVVAIMDLDPARGREVADACGSAAVFTDASSMINDDDVDAVVIASPDPTHADLAIACIEAGKPTLCEKPLGLDISDAMRVLQAEVTSGKRLVQVGLMREFDPQHAAVKRAILDGKVGRPLLFRGIHKHWHQERTAVDVIVNSAVHDIHSARWLMGDDVVTVFADHIVADPKKPESTRLVLLQLKFRGGGLGTIEVDVDDNYGYEVVVELSGEHGTLRTPSVIGPILRKEGLASQAIEADWLARFEMAYVLEADAWVRAVLEGTRAGATVWDGYAAMQVAEAAARSLSSGKAEKLPDEARPEIYEAN